MSYRNQVRGLHPAHLSQSANMFCFSVIPEKAGIQTIDVALWIPAFAEMTVSEQVYSFPYRSSEICFNVLPRVFGVQMVPTIRMAIIKNTIMFPAV